MLYLKRAVIALLVLLMLCAVLSSCNTEEVEGHQHDTTTVEENHIDSTCDKQGSYDEVVYCSTCNEEISRTQKTVAKRTHEYDVTNACTGCGCPVDPGLEFAFDSTENAYSISKYNGNEALLEIPSTYNGYPVTGIGRGAFKNCYTLTSITIPKSITHIYNTSFTDCFKLVEVVNYSDFTIGTGLVTNGVVVSAWNVQRDGSEIVNIDGFLFGTKDTVHYLLGYIGNATELTLPQDYKGEEYRIYKYAFYSRTDLRSITIPKNVTQIGDYAFYGCAGLMHVTCSGSITKIGGYAFAHCTGLMHVTFSESITKIGN